MSSFSETTDVSIEKIKLRLVDNLKPSPVNMYRVKLIVNGNYENRSRCSYICATSLDNLSTHILALIESLQDEAYREHYAYGEHSDDHIRDDFFTFMIKVDGSRPSLSEQFFYDGKWMFWKFGKIAIESVIDDNPVFSYMTYN